MTGRVSWEYPWANTSMVLKFQQTHDFSVCVGEPDVKPILNWPYANVSATTGSGMVTTLPQYSGMFCEFRKR